MEISSYKKDVILKRLFPDVTDIISNRQIYNIAKQMCFKPNNTLKLEFEKYGVH